MNLELTEDARQIVLHALQVYLSDLREEITKTERLEWREKMHQEETVLKEAIARLSGTG
jgi:hypothetical protein